MTTWPRESLNSRSYKQRDEHAGVHGVRARVELATFLEHPESYKRMGWQDMRGHSDGDLVRLACDDRVAEIISV